MDRRRFLHLAPAATLACYVNGSAVKALAANPLLQLLAKQTQSNGRVLVLVQLSGGNDGLNTIIPIDEYSALSAARANILIPESKILSLNGTFATGMHPAMQGIRQMYDDGLVSITQSVGYPDPNFSHFRATDIWMNGSDSAQYLNTGWIGRKLNADFPDYPVVEPSYPPAIQIGFGLATVLQGPKTSMGMAISDIDHFYNIINTTVLPAPHTPQGNELTFIRFISQQTQRFTSVIQDAAQKADNMSALYPTDNALANQLKIVSRLIAGGLQTPVYVVSMSGFDTHARQVESSDHTLGAHARLLKQFSEAIFAFQDDLQKLKIADRVATMAYSEFGRRITSNAGLGTDHGTAEPVMVFGTKLIPGFIGANPTIPKNATVEDNLTMQYDYRSIYTSILEDWFELPQEDTDHVLLRPFPSLSIFKKHDDLPGNADNLLGQNYPNPSSNRTTIPFRTTGGTTELRLLDMDGRLIRILADKNYEPGDYQLSIITSELAAGNYFYELTNNGKRFIKKMTVLP